MLGMVLTYVSGKTLGLEMVPLHISMLPFIMLCDAKHYDGRGVGECPSEYFLLKGPPIAGFDYISM
jgi:hypothetical protein